MEINKTIYQTAKDLLDTCLPEPSKATNIYEVLKDFLGAIEEYELESEVTLEHANLDYSNNVYTFAKEPKDGDCFEGVFTRNKIVKLGDYRGFCLLNKETNQLEFSMTISTTTGGETRCIKKEDNVWKNK